MGITQKMTSYIELWNNEVKYVFLEAFLDWFQLQQAIFAFKIPIFATNEGVRLEFELVEPKK